MMIVAALLYVLSRNYDTRTLEGLIERAWQAKDKTTVEEIERALANDDRQSYFNRLQEEVRRARGSTDRADLEKHIENIKEEWPLWKEDNDAARMRRTLDRLVERADRVREATGHVAPPRVAREGYGTPTPGTTENVAPLGRALFADYLLAVELGGTLLLVATIGAIAISGRRREELR
jgi:hypothetical protein